MISPHFTCGTQHPTYDQIRVNREMALIENLKQGDATIKRMDLSIDLYFSIVTASKNDLDITTVSLRANFHNTRTHR